MIIYLVYLLWRSAGTGIMLGLMLGLRLASGGMLGEMNSEPVNLLGNRNCLWFSWYLYLVSSKTHAWSIQNKWKGTEEIKTTHVSGKEQFLDEHAGIFMTIKGSCSSLWELDGYGSILFNWQCCSVPWWEQHLYLGISLCLWSTLMELMFFLCLVMSFHQSDLCNYCDNAREPQFTKLSFLCYWLEKI